MIPSLDTDSLTTSLLRNLNGDFSFASFSNLNEWKNCHHLGLDFAREMGESYVALCVLCGLKNKLPVV